MRIAIGFLVFGLLIFAYCGEAEEDHIFEFGKEERFVPNEAYLSVDGAMKLTIDQLSDSRCPKNAICIWQGEVALDLSVETDHGFSVELHSVLQPRDTIDEYIFEIIGATPYPESGKEIQKNDYRVTLKVSRL